MKIVSVAMVRNESDIIEPFVRHNLVFVDHLHVLLHASVDPTGEILGRLAGEGLALSVEREADFVFNKQSRFNAAMARAIELHRPEFVVPLDADEFIAAESRVEMERELARIPHDGWLGVSWATYVPVEDDDPTESNPIKRMRYCRILPERPEPVKAFFRAEAFAIHGGKLNHGQHSLVRGDGSLSPSILAQKMTLAHYPVRSAGQLASKTMVGWLSRRVSEDYEPRASAYWKSLNSSAAIRRTPGELRKIAERYHVEEDLPNVGLVLRPLHTPVQALRYGDLIDVDPLVRVFRQAEEMAGRLGQVSTILDGKDIDRARINRMMEERAKALFDIELLQLRQRHEIEALRPKLEAEVGRVGRRNRTIKLLILLTILLALALAAALFLLAFR